MGLKRLLSDCRKGDINDKNLLDVLVERSSTNDDVTISLWKRDDKFQLALCNRGSG